MTHYEQLSTREDAQQSMLDLLRTPTFGVEVTDPALGAACLAGNLDPQHLGRRSDLSAIEVLTKLLQGEGQVATISPDLDSIGSMAVLDIAMGAIAQLNALAGAIMQRIELIGKADRFERGDWPGVRPLPTIESPWCDEIAGASDTRELAAMAAVVADFKLPLEERVKLLRRWLTTGEEPTEYRAKVEAERLDMVKALTDGHISIDIAGNSGRIAVVISTHRAGLAVGYHRASVVIALNPEFRFKGAEPIRKFTVSQYREGLVDLRAVFAALSEIEPGWGGSPVIGGSPQGVSSVIETEEVVRIVEEHLLG